MKTFETTYSVNDNVEEAIQTIARKGKEGWELKWMGEVAMRKQYKHELGRKPKWEDPKIPYGFARPAGFGNPGSSHLAAVMIFQRAVDDTP